jgi:hypothetical protein
MKSEGRWMKERWSQREEEIYFEKWTRKLKEGATTSSA